MFKQHYNNQMLEPLIESKTHRAKHHNNDNNLFIQVEEESLAMKNTRTGGELMRTF